MWVENYAPTLTYRSSTWIVWFTFCHLWQIFGSLFAICGKYCVLLDCMLFFKFHFISLKCLLYVCFFRFYCGLVVGRWTRDWKVVSSSPPSVFGTLTHIVAASTVLYLNVLYLLQGCTILCMSYIVSPICMLGAIRAKWIKHYKMNITLQHCILTIYKMYSHNLSLWFFSPNFNVF